MKSCNNSNLFVRCPDGQTLCLNGLDLTSESPQSVRSRIVEKWHPETNPGGSRTDNVLFPFFAVFVASFLSAAGILRPLSDEDLYLTCRGKVLDAASPIHASLADYGILADGSTVDAFVRVRGGCFMISLSLLTVIVGAMMMSVFTCGGALLVIPFLAPFLFVLPFFCL